LTQVASSAKLPRRNWYRKWNQVWRTAKTSWSSWWRDWKIM